MDSLLYSEMSNHGLPIMQSVVSILLSKFPPCEDGKRKDLPQVRPQEGKQWQLFADTSCGISFSVGIVK